MKKKHQYYINALGEVLPTLHRNNDNCYDLEISHITMLVTLSESCYHDGKNFHSYHNGTYNMSQVFHNYGHNF